MIKVNKEWNSLSRLVKDEDTFALIGRQGGVVGELGEISILWILLHFYLIFKTFWGFGGTFF